MPLILAATPTSDWQRIVPLLERAGMQPEYPGNPESWYQTELADADTSKHYLLLHTRPEIALARALATGATPEAALNQWLLAAQDLVSFYKRHRRQSVMVNLAHLRAQPRAMLQAIAGSLNIHCEQAADSEAEGMLQQEELPALELLLATQLVRQTPNIDGLLAQLEACSLPLDGHGYSAPPVDVVQVIHSLKRQEFEKAQHLDQLASTQQALEQLQRELNLRGEENQTLAAQCTEADGMLGEARTENRLLLDQLHQVQEELERQILHSRGLDDQLKQAQQETQTLTARVKQGEAEKQTAQAELSLLTQKLSSAQINEQRQLQERNRLQHTVTELNKQLAGLANDRDEKSLLLQQLNQVQEDLVNLTQALGVAQLNEQRLQQEKDRLHKAMGEANSRLAELAGGQDENRLLLEQLHQVQEELERQFLRGRVLEEELKHAQQEAASLTTRVKKGEAEQQTAQAELAKLTQALSTAKSNEQRLQQEKDRLEKSLVEANEQLIILNGVRAEHSLVLEQLHLVQEAFERQFLHTRQVERQLDEYRQSQDHALDVANREIAQLQNQLNNFRSSKAWKATAPVRALGKTFRRGTPESKSLKRQVSLVKASGLFNQEWYLASYPDVAKEGIDPIAHYLKFGAKEGRNPSPEFDSAWYLSSYPDVAQEGINPLVHYIKFGRQEQRAPHNNYYPTLPAPHGNE